MSQKLIKEPLLASVIVPVYRADRLGRCIESMTGQTYERWELILVDDGSPDGAGDLCEVYAVKDRRIRVIHQKNRGLGAARNEGMKQCRGTWLYFLDSDDYLAPEAFFLLYKTVTEKKADLAVAGHNRVESDGWVHCDSSGWPSFSSDADIRKAVIRNSLPNFAWGKLYLRRLWEGISFPENVLVEDMYALPWVFVRASHMEVLKTPLYFYSHENRNSIMNGTGDAYIRIRYGRFGGWRVHEQAAAEVCPEYCGECALKAIKAGIRACLLNAGIEGEALTAWEEQDIRRYLQARNHMALPAGERVMRNLILRRSALLPLLGRLSRELVNKQQARRMKRLYGAGRGDR